MQTCDHPNMKDTARRDWCPDCGYEYYYGDAHAANEEDRISKLVNKGRDARANGIWEPERGAARGSDMPNDGFTFEDADEYRYDDYD